MEFFPEVDISEAQAEAMARGLFAVARADGEVHQREAAMVADFYRDTGAGGVATLAALERAPDIEPGALAETLGPGTDVARLFLKTAVLLAWTDGTYGAPEGQLLRRYAAALAIDEQALARIEEEVKEFLLSHLSHLVNVDAAAQVAKKMGA